MSDLRIILVEVFFSLVLIDNESHYPILEFVHDSTFHILIIWSLMKYHNNVFLVKFSHFLKIFFGYASNQVLVNAVLKTNILTDITKFFEQKVYGNGQASIAKEEYLWFYRDLVQYIREVSNVKFF